MMCVQKSISNNTTTRNCSSFSLVFFVHHIFPVAGIVAGTAEKGRDCLAQCIISASSISA
jgi:hypothetical protein